MNSAYNTFYMCRFGMSQFSSPALHSTFQEPQKGFGATDLWLKHTEAS